MSAVLHAYKVDKDIKCIPLTVLEFWNAEIHPEVLGWYALMGAIKEQEDMSGKKIGVIVDSNLGDIDKYNSREKPLFGNEYIPPNVTLIYASADKKDSIANKLIWLCDDLASSQFETMQNIGVLDDLKEAPYPCEYFRQWIHNSNR